MPEVTAGVLDVLAESGDVAAMWGAAPADLREGVESYVAAHGVSEAWFIGENDPEWRAERTARYREIATALFGGPRPPEP
jgi:hypothetical protein